MSEATPTEAQWETIRSALKAIKSTQTDLLVDDLEEAAADLNDAIGRLENWLAYRKDHSRV